MRTRAVVVALNGSQFWLANCTFVSNEAEDDSAIIYSNQNQLMQHIVDSTSQFKQLLSIFEFSSVSKSIVNKMGRLVTLIDSNLEMTEVSFQQNEQIYDENYGIVVIYSTLEIKNCLFIGPAQSPFLKKLYYPKIKDV